LPTIIGNAAVVVAAPLKDGQFKAAQPRVLLTSDSNSHQDCRRRYPLPRNDMPSWVALPEKVGHPGSYSFK